MNKEMVLFIPSRSNPGPCKKTINLLYETCASKDNFDIVCIVDDDEINLYKEVIDMFPEVIWKHPPHIGPNSKHIKKIIFETVKNCDYFFSWDLVDDMVSFTDNWDQEIIKTKNLYPDGFYTCFSSNPMKRNLNAMNSCFRAPCLKWINGYSSPLVSDPVELIYHYHEMLPICTKKWKMALSKFYDKDFVGPDMIFLNSSLCYLLSKEHGYSRNVMVNLEYENGIDSNRSSKVLYQGLNRDEFYYKFAKHENFNLIRPVSNLVAKKIWQHYRDIMDKPRGIGKYAK
jgi:hypothetical protein